MPHSASLRQPGLFDDNFTPRDAQINRAQRIESLPRFPTTRYQGSKRKLLPQLKRVFGALSFESALDLFSGTGTVALLLRQLGKRVQANDYLAFNATCADLLLRATKTELREIAYEDRLRWLINEAPVAEPVVSNLYRNIFFKDSENCEIDRFSQNVNSFTGVERSLYVFAFGQALLKKRPYNLFHRANLSMRTRDVERSFGNAATWETPALNHALGAVREVLAFPFSDRATGAATRWDATEIERFDPEVDLVYLDPPYVSSKGVGIDYSDFYGFLDGLLDANAFKLGDARLPHRPLRRAASPWSRAESSLYELESISRHFPRSVLVLSYRADSAIHPDQLAEVLSANGRRIEGATIGGYKYALSIERGSDECIIVSLP